MSETASAKYEINVITSGLGEVVKVDATPPSGSSSRKYSYYKKVFFVPNNGVYINSMAKSYSSVSTYGDGTTQSGNGEEAVTFDPQTKDVENISLLGCQYLGIEYESTFPEGAGVPVSYIQTTTYSVSGIVNNVSLRVVGEGTASVQKIFQYDTSSGVCTFLCRKTNSSQTYTNLVGMFSSQVRFTSGINNNVSVSDNCIYLLNQSSILLPNYETYDLKIKTVTEDPLTEFILYSNCRLCVFAFGTSPSEQINWKGTYSNWRTQVSSMLPSAAASLKNGSADMKNLYCGYIYVPIGSLTIKSGGQKKYLYTDGNIHSHIFENMALDGSDQRLATMVDAYSGTIPDDLSWVEGLADGFGNKISRYTHVVRLVGNSDSMQIEGIVGAESKYARFTGYWRAYGQYWNSTKKSMYGMYKYLNKGSSLPNTSGNVVLHPVFKPFAECDLFIIPENDAFPVRYARIFLNKLKSIYRDDAENKGDPYRKSWYANAKDQVQVVRKKLYNFAKTVCPYKNLILSCHGGREEFSDGTGYTEIQISDDKAMLNGMLQNAIDTSKYWWDTKFCFGLFSSACYGQGFQEEYSQPSLKNCVVHDPKKVIPDIDNMFYVLGATATHYNFSCKTLLGEFQLEEPLVNTAKSEKYPDFCTKFNNLENNYKSEVFKEITKFYVNYYDDMVKCLKSEEDQEMWDRTYDIILDDLKNCGRMYFCIPYREPNDYLINSPNTWFHLDGEGDGEVDEKDYYVHDGFVGLIRREIFEEDGPNPEKGLWGNSKKFFVELADEDILGHMLYDASLERIKKGLKKLKQAVEAKLKIKFGYGYPSILKAIALTEPSCGCSGYYKTSNAPLMANPNEEYDNWLKGDSELAILENMTNNWIYYGLD